MQNSPLNRIDPDGLTDYTISGNGKIEMVAGTETEDGNDRLIRGKAKYKKNGNIRGKEGKKYIEMEKGILDEMETDGENFQVFKMESGEEAEEVYDFIGNAINAEMGKYDIIRGDGTEESIFRTSFEWGSIGGGTASLENLLDQDPDLQLVSVMHNHGNNPDPNSNSVGSYSPSGRKPGDISGDVPQAAHLNNVFINQANRPRYFIWRFGRRTEYDENTRK